MPLTPRTCVVLTCDVCADGWAALDVEPHFANRVAAVHYAKTVGWVVTRSRAVCRECTQVEVCALTGHRWNPWTAAGPFPSAHGGTWEGRVRHCRVCSSAEWDPPVANRGASRGEQAG